MVEGFRGRMVNIGERYNVYRNLNNGLFSIQDLRTGLVVAHGRNFQLSDVEFKISASGKKGVMKSKVRNVHAKAQGIFIGPKDSRETGREISYNPFIEKGFYYVDTGEEVSSTESLYVENKKIYGS